MTNTQRKFFEQARKIAQTSQFKGFQHGAILVKGGCVFSCSVNKNRYNKFAQRFVQHSGHGTIHAEIGCILGLAKSVTKGSVIYVVRIDRDNKFKMSRPCEMCIACLSHVGVRTVLYSISEDEFGVLYI